MSNAVEKALEMTDEKDTLIIVTADHSHVFTMGGYNSINNDILGKCTQYKIPRCRHICVQMCSNLLNHNNITACSRHR